MQASGNVGDINYTRHRGRSIARAASVPTGSPTPAQTSQRGRLTTTTKHWGADLTPGERATWDTAALETRFTDRLGQSYVPNGFQLFMKINLQANFLGGFLQKVPPDRPANPFVYMLQVGTHPFVQANEVWFMKSYLVRVEADGFQIFRAGPYTSGGRKAILPEYRYLGMEKMNYYYYDYGVIDGKWYWYKVRWFFEVGYVGNWWESQVETKFAP